MIGHLYTQLKQVVLIPLLLFCALNVCSQSVYSGTIGGQPVELVMNLESNNDAGGIYVYSKYNEPIVIAGEFKHDSLILSEYTAEGKLRATLHFESFDRSADQVSGYWQATGASVRIPIRLNKSFQLAYGDSTEWKDREIIQPVSLPDHYFRLMVSKTKGEFYPFASGIRIMDKKTGRLIQQFDLECQLSGLNNLELGDYNFDGNYDFSVFESSYAGPNTSRVYFLYDTATRLYFNSGFEGTSLEFDSETKRIYMHNQCCGGRSHMMAEYKLVNNKMVLVKETCLEYDEKIDDFREVKCD